MIHPPDQPASLGADLRALRKARGVTLAELAADLNRSVGWLSQVERDLSEPSITDLRHIAARLDVSVSMLFGHAPAPAGEAGYVVRQESRRPIGSNEAGLVEELLGLGDVVADVAKRQAQLRQEQEAQEELEDMHDELAQVMR